MIETTDYLGLAAWVCRPDKHAFARRDPLPLPDEPEPDHPDGIGRCAACGADGMTLDARGLCAECRR